MTRWACALVALLALFAVPGTGPTARAGDGWWGRLDEGEAVSLASVMADPGSYRHRTITFFCVFHSREQYFDPVRTPFNSKRHDNFSVWPDGAPIWEERGFQRDLPFLYIERSHPERDALMALEMITRIEITGKVRAVSARGQPFIEVFSFRVTGHRLGRRVVRAVNAGDNYARLGTRRGNQLAARNYRDALTPDLPPVYALVVRKRLAGALRRLGNDRDADLVERGEILGGGAIPEPDAGAPRVATPPEPTPGAPPPSVPVLPPSELPGVPRDRDAPPPTAPVVPPEDLPGTVPITPDSDLPGQPTGNPRAPDVLPPPRASVPGGPQSTAPAPEPREPGLGTPPTGPPPGLPPPTVKRPDGTPPGAFPPAVPERDAEAEPPKKKPRPPSLPGVPPKRRPRLSGVK